MKTPTHIAINYLISTRLNIQSSMRKYFLLGGAAPDIPICLIFIVVYFCSPNLNDTVDTFRHLYEHNPWVMAAHSLLHSPMSLLILFVAISLTKKRKKLFEIILFGCFSHSLIDIYTHVDDGPLMVWPFNWSVRFSSTWSHWDKDFGGEWVLIIEATIITIALVKYVYSRYAQPLRV